MTEPRVACVGCRGLVPDIEGPVHRYMLAAPGCWAAYTSLLGSALAGLTVPAAWDRHHDAVRKRAMNLVALFG